MADFMMPLHDLFQWVSEIPSSIAIRESLFVSPWLTVSHVISMCLFGGLIVMMDLRLVGIGNMRTPFSELQRRLFPWQMLGMGLSSVTGLTLTFSDPMRFYVNIFFWTKMLVMVLAGINALAFHFITYNSVVTWDSRSTTPFGAKLSGALSILLWAIVIVSGRLIPYNWFQN
jgi:Family of unknown function (DUF6644)